MTTNQEGRQAAIRDSTSTAYGVAADWNALFDDAGISAGTFNERLLAWINDQLGTSYSNLLGAMAAYAADAGFNAWSSISTLVLGGASTLLSGETDGLAFDFTDSSARIKDTSTPANEYSSTGIVSSGELVGPSGKLTYTSPSKKLTLQSDGVMRYQAHNLCTYSEDLTNVNWLKGGSSATAVDTITEDGSTGAHRVYRQFASLPTADYRIKVRISASDRHIYFIAQNSSNLVYAWINTSTWTIAESGDNGSVTLDSATLTAVGDGTYDLDIVARNLVGAFFIQFYMADTIGTGPNPPSYAGDTVSTLAVSRIQLNLYPANTDYIRTTTAAKYALPIEYDTSGNCLGLLVEEARTNLAPYSTTFDSGSWSLFGSVSRGSTAADPSGLTNAVEITFSGGGEFYAFANPTAGTTVTISCWVKRNAGSDQTFRLKGVSTGAVNEWSGDFTATSEWQRFSYTFASSEGGNYSIGSDSVNSASAILVWGFQVEIGSFPTSLVQTFGAAATRAADNISIATSAFPYQTGPQTVYAHIDDFKSSAGRVLCLYGAENIRNSDVSVVTSTTLTSFDNHTSGGTMELLTGAFDGSVENRIAVAYANNDKAGAVNGSVVASDTSITIDAVATILALGYPAGLNISSFTMKAISYVPRRKTDAELQTETA